MSCKSLDAKTIFWEHISTCLPVFTKLFGFIHHWEQGTHMAHVNFWSDLVPLFWHFHCFFHATEGTEQPVQ